jgi:predicted metal-dependent enzyme (double-stranded beta helix superfamily)
LFDIDSLLADCQVALRDNDPQAATREVLERALSRPEEAAEALGPASAAGVYTLHSSPEFTVLNAVWAPQMSVNPHNHNMWAVVGVYTGQEVNTFYRRTDQGLVSHGGRAIASGQAVVLSEDVIHSLTNPTAGFTSALRIYGGDYYCEPRSQWDPDTMEELPYDVTALQRHIARTNAELLQGRHHHP